MTPIRIALCLLLVHGALGAFDTFYNHEWVEHLPSRPNAATELLLHSARSWVFVATERASSSSGHGSPSPRRARIRPSTTNGLTRVGAKEGVSRAVDASLSARSQLPRSRCTRARHPVM